MSENPNPKAKNPMTHFDFLKKFKRLKALETSPGVLGCFLFTLCLLFCLFLLDYRTVTSGIRFRGPSWFGASGNQTLLTSDVDRKLVEFLEEGGDGCDIFEGSWVWDESYPLYQSQDCLFLDGGFRCTENGRPDSFYTKWRWQPKDCNLPRFSSILLHLLCSSAFYSILFRCMSLWKLESFIFFLPLITIKGNE